MADTNTVNYSFILVEVGASRDTWGSKTNTNMTSIDSNLKTLSNTDANLQTQITNNLNSANGTYTTLRNEYKAWVPIGTVCLWVFGTATDVPTGWAVCDGRTVTRTDGAGPLTTPNMMGRFILADPTGSNTGGSYTGSAATSAAGSHSHGGATGDHALTIAEMPAHTHTIPNFLVASGGSHFTLGGGGDQVLSGQSTGATGSGAVHNHPIVSDGGHSHTVTMTIVPNYFTAIYIMRY